MPFIPKPHTSTALTVVHRTALLRAYDITESSRLISEIDLPGKRLTEQWPDGVRRRLLARRDAETILIKEVPWYTTVPDTLFALELQERMCAAGFPAPRLIRNAAGCLLTAIDSGSTRIHFFAQQIVAARTWCRASCNIESVGALCAEFSVVALAATHRLETNHRRKEDPWDTATRALNHCVALDAEESARIALPPALVRHMRRHLNYTRPDPRSSVSPVPIHGDFNSTNVLFDAAGRAALLADFDDVALGAPGFDMARGLHFFCGQDVDQQSQRLRDWPRALDASAVSEFLTGYSAVCTAPAEPDFRALPAVAIHVFCLGWLDGCWTVADVEAATEFFEHPDPEGMIA